MDKAAAVRRAGNTGPPHQVFAMLTFLAGGAASVASRRRLTTPLRWLALALGIVALLALITAVFTPGVGLIPLLGVGGAERWIAYPIVLWTVVFGSATAGCAGEEPPLP